MTTTKPRGGHSSPNIACPICNGPLGGVTDSRQGRINVDGHYVIRRRRVCEKCGEKSTTIEVDKSYLENMRKEILKEIAVGIMVGNIK